MTPRTHLATARLYAAEKAPYFRAALMNIVPREAPGLGTLGVTKNAVMIYDPVAIMRWSIEELGAALVHEVGHLLRDHHGRAESMGIVDANGRAVAGNDGSEAAIWNVAGDCEINDDLLAGGWTLPKLTDPNTGKIGEPCAAKQFGMSDGLTAEEYYSELRKQQQKSGKCAHGKGKGNGKGKKRGEKGEGEGEGEGGGGSKQAMGPGHGWCGSAGGKALPDEPDQKEEPGRSKTDLNRIKKQVAEEIRKEAERGRGSVPGGWERWAGSVLKTPKVPWRQKLARAARRAMADVLGAVDYKYKRPARRQAALGYGFGKPILPIMRAPKPEVAIAIDTSGSMGAQEMEDAVTEARGVLLAVGADCSFMACDADLHANVRVRGYQDIIKNLKGGGGTDFRPVFDAVKQMRIRPDVLVFVTDGMGPTPDVQPTGLHVIWLLVGPYKQKPCDWGECIEITENEQEAA